MATKKVAAACGGRLSVVSWWNYGAADGTRRSNGSKLTDSDGSGAEWSGVDHTVTDYSRGNDDVPMA